MSKSKDSLWHQQPVINAQFGLKNKGLGNVNMLYLQSTLVIFVPQKWKDKKCTRFSHTLITPKGPWPNSPELGGNWFTVVLYISRNFLRVNLTLRSQSYRFFLSMLFAAYQMRSSSFSETKADLIFEQHLGLKNKENVSKKLVNVRYNVVNMKLHISLDLNTTSCTRL